MKLKSSQKFQIIRAGWHNATYDKLLDASDNAVGDERFKLLHATNDLLGNSHIVIPLYYYTDLQMIKENVKGWEKTTRSLF